MNEVSALTGAGVGSMADVSADVGQLVADTHEYVIHTWTAQRAVNPMAIAGARGSYFWDFSGRKYLDFGSQLVNQSIGHQHPAVVAAIKDQADKLCYIGPKMANVARTSLAKKLAEITPGDLRMSLFTTGGAESNENAIRLARAYTGRHKIITRAHSYHGGTYAMLSLSGDKRRWPIEPGMSGVVRMLDPYTYRCPCGHPTPCPVCTGAPHLEELIAREGADSIAAVIMEPITGSAGMIVPPDGYLQAIRDVCDRYNILLILDEVMVGFGRTGKWFACDNWNVTPDIMTVAKGINSGYVPLGAMIVSEKLSEWLWDHNFPGGLTYSGHPLACASALASIRAMEEERMVENAGTIGELIAESLDDMVQRHISIGDVRGKGCFYALELVNDRMTKQSLIAAHPDAIKRIDAAALERGLYLNNPGSILRIAPPINVSVEDARRGLEIIDEVLAVADKLCQSKT